MNEAGPKGFEQRNPSFGQGALRRRVRLIAEGNEVRAGVEDAYHSFRLTLRHDGQRIVDILPRFERVPLTTCPSAEEPLRRLIGTPLETGWRELAIQENPRTHCTHLFDLAVLAMAQARRGGARSYDVVVPDEHPGAVWTVLQRDGETLFRWRTFESRILEPVDLADKPLLRGFSRWATARFEGDELEAALVLHKAYFVSRARAWNVEAGADKPVAHHTMIRDACHSYSEPQMSIAIRNRGTTIDTSDPAVPLVVDLT
jgi:hypothetical protein